MQGEYFMLEVKNVKNKLLYKAVAEFVLLFVLNQQPLGWSESDLKFNPLGPTQTNDSMEDKIN